MTRWLVTGAGGMLGRDLLDVLGGQDVTAADRAALDITDRDAVTAAVHGHDVVLNAAAWTDVDAAEADEAAATAVNGTAVGHLARACARTGAVLVHVSTGAVLGGRTPVPLGEDAPPRPVNAYGRSKLVGERLVRELLPERGHVVRTSWLYGRHGRNLVATVLRLARRRDTIDVVADQWGQPTWSLPVARHLVQLAGGSVRIHHATARGRASWYELARAAFTLAGLDPGRIRAVGRDLMPRAAPQSPYELSGHSPLPHWRDMLAAAFAAGVFDDLGAA